MTPYSETEIMLNKDGSVYHLNLLPEHLSEYIITVSEPSRVFMVSSFFDKIILETNHREFFTHIGTYKGKKITAISTGMGTPNIETLLTELNFLANFDLQKRILKPKHKKLKIIRIGLSAAIQEDIPLESHLISNHAIGIDNLLSFYEFSQKPIEQEICVNLQQELGFSHLPYLANVSDTLFNELKIDAEIGNTITTPGFYAPQGRLAHANIKYPKLLNDISCFHFNNFWFSNIEMETAAYYALGQMLNHDIVSLNAIILNRIKNKVSKNPNKVLNALIKKVLQSIASQADSPPYIK